MLKITKSIKKYDYLHINKNYNQKKIKFTKI